VNAETLAPGRLAALLEGTAAGLLADTAAAGLIIAHGHLSAYSFCCRMAYGLM
jgi:hypothetical protein